MNNNLIDQYKPNEAWLVFTVESPIENEPMQVYSMMDVASTYILGSIFVPVGKQPERKEVLGLFQNAFRAQQKWPKILLFSD